MTELILAVNSTQAVQGVNAISREVQDFAKKADEAASRVDDLETQVSDLGKQLDTNRRSTSALADENKRLKDALNGTQAQMDAAAQKARQFQQAAGSLTELQSIGARTKILGEEIGNLGTSFGSTARVGQAFAGVLLDVAQVGDKAKGGFSAFTSLLRSNPLLAAAGVISAIATAMSLFSGQTAEANVELEKQIKLQEQLRQTGVDLSLQIQRNADLKAVGFDVNLQEQELLRARRLTEVAADLKGQGGFQTFADLQALTGLSEAQLRSRAGEAGIARSAVQVVPVPGEGVPVSIGGQELGGLTNDAARQIVLEVARLIKQQAPSFAPVPTEQGPGFTSLLNLQQIRTLQDLQRGARATGQAFGPPIPEGLPGQYSGNALPTVGVSEAGYAKPIGPEPGPEYMSPTELAAYQKQFAPPTVLLDPEKMKQDAEELERFNEKLREMKSLGQDVGAALGGAFFSIVNGAANARQALAALLQQFVAIAQQRAIQGIANSIGNAFGSTVQQTNANAQTPGTANTGVSLRGGATP